MQNHLKDQTSPYLLQHAENPVDWYPWCEEAFRRAKAEDKPVFLSIGYSTCHWCHVMAHESFEDEGIAALLNRYFIAVKVDREERPDIDNIYMTVCQAFTGSGGWPATIFLTPEQKPFFAGTYFPKTSAYGRIGLKELLIQVHERWETARGRLLQSADEIISILSKNVSTKGELKDQLIEDAVCDFKRSFDEQFGGFGDAPKFPMPHNLLFLMRYYEKSRDEAALRMAEKTLFYMHCGGIFDHIGGGFSRYSTDRYFLVPHFEKMLYDNALLILAYCKAYEITKKELYRDTAEHTAAFVLREMRAPEGGFYSAQDADSEGIEGKYYLFEPSELVQLLGKKEGAEFNQYFDITERGNFEGKSIPNILQHEALTTLPFSKEKERLKKCKKAVYKYRKGRYALHLDDKILTSWNGLMIAALCSLYRVSGDGAYLEAAVLAWEFIDKSLCDKDVLYVSFRNGQRGGRGFLDDYAFSIFALLALYEAALDHKYLCQAEKFCNRVISDFYDRGKGGFFLYGNGNEPLVLRPKEAYDGAVFSGNSAMAYNLVRLSFLGIGEAMGELTKEQLAFMGGEAEKYPAGYCMFLMALLDYRNPPDKITIVVKDKRDLAGLSCKIPIDTVVCVLEKPTKEYPLVNDKTTYYVCTGQTCKPPVNELEDANPARMLDI